MATYQYFAQPIENISSKRVIVYELLLREWDKAENHWITPRTYELSADLLIDLLSSAIKKLNDKHVSINLTNKQFANPDVAKALTSFVNKNMVPKQLTVELVATPDFDVLREMSAVYRAAGIMIAIDDVGSDNLYDEVKDLLPYVNTIKFALQNIRERANSTSPKDIESLNFWFNQAEDQQMLFTFEGIENEADVALANRFGINRGQGYFFSRPLKPEVFKEISVNND